MVKKLMSAMLGVVASTALAGVAAAQSCDDLYVQRNQIYKENGYCFNTPRGVQTFGNAGCRFDNVNDVPLSNRDRAAVADIARMERVMGCR